MSAIPASVPKQGDDARAALAQCTGDLRFANQRLDFSRAWYNARRKEYGKKP
jgi:hypothetical protein